MYYQESSSNELQTKFMAYFIGVALVDIFLKWWIRNSITCSPCVALNQCLILDLVSSATGYAQVLGMNYAITIYGIGPFLFVVVLLGLAPGICLGSECDVISNPLTYLSLNVNALCCIPLFASRAAAHVVGALLSHIVANGVITSMLSCCWSYSMLTSMHCVPMAQDSNMTVGLTLEVIAASVAAWVKSSCLTPHFDISDTVIRVIFSSLSQGFTGGLGLLVMINPAFSVGQLFGCSPQHISYSLLVYCLGSIVGTWLGASFCCSMSYQPEIPLSANSSSTDQDNSPEESPSPHAPKKKREPNPDKPNPYFDPCIRNPCCFTGIPSVSRPQPPYPMFRQGDYCPPMPSSLLCSNMRPRVQERIVNGQRQVALVFDMPPGGSRDLSLFGQNRNQRSADNSVNKKSGNKNGQGKTKSTNQKERGPVGSVKGTSNGSTKSPYLTEHNPYGDLKSEFPGDKADVSSDNTNQKSEVENANRLTMSAEGIKDNTESDTASEKELHSSSSHNTTSSSKGKDKGKDKDKHKGKDRDKHKDSDTDKDKHKDNDKDKGKDKDKHKDSDTDKDKHKDNDKHKGKDKHKHKDSDTDKDKHKHKDKEKDKDSDTDKDKHKHKDTDKDKEKDNEKDKHKDKGKDTDKEKAKVKHHSGKPGSNHSSAKSSSEKENDHADGKSSNDHSVTPASHAASSKPETSSHGKSSHKKDPGSAKGTH